MDFVFSLLLIFIPIAAIADLIDSPPLVVFVFSALAIIPLAKLIGDATEHLSRHLGPAVGGLFNVTFGNATELIIGIFALKAGLIEVVKASLTGSIISNLLLVLGTAMFAGGLRHVKQTFNKTAAMANGSTLFLAVIALVMPAIFLQTALPPTNIVVENLSIFVSLLIMTLYVASLFFSLHTHKHLYIEEALPKEGGWSKEKSLVVLVLSAGFVAWMSEILTGSIHPLILTLGWTELFIGVIFIAIIGNAAEHASAIQMAVKNKMDLALQISIGSTSQIAMFVAPVLVLMSIFFPMQLTLIFNSFELVAIVLSVILVNLVVADGESNWLEGLQLLVAYAIMGVAFFFHP